MKKSRKTMLRASLVMLIVSTLSLSSATFAWFTAGKDAKVTEFKITAQSASGMQISTDGEAWTSEVDVSKLTSASSGQDGTTLVGPLSPVSTVGDLDDTSKYIKFFSGTITGDKLSTSAVTDGSGYYYQFNLYFKNDGSSAQNLNFDMSSTIAGFSGSEKVGTETVTYTKSGIENAARIAFVVDGSCVSPTVKTPAVKYTQAEADAYNATLDGHVSENDDVPEDYLEKVKTAAAGAKLTEDEAKAYNATLDGAKTTADIKTPAVYNSLAETARELKPSSATSADCIWEPNALTHDDASLSSRNSAKWENAKRSYDGIKVADSSLEMGTGYTANIAKNATDKVVEVTTVTGYPTTLTTNVDTQSGNELLISMPANSITKVTVYVWIEGQDIDCNNSESGGTFKVNLKFNCN